MLTVLEIIIIILATSFFSLIVLLFVAIPLLSYLSKPSNPGKAIISGKELISSNGMTVIAVTAHPDDAEWYSGGTLAMLAQNNKVILILSTSGEKGASGPNTGKIREEKQGMAEKLIGYEEVIFLRHPDRGLKNSKVYRDQLNHIFDKNKPDIVFTFDPLKQGFIYHHSDHLAAGQATTEVIKNFGKTKLIYFHSSDNNMIVDFSPVKDIKKQALKALFNYGQPGLAQKLLKIISLGRTKHLMYGVNETFPSIKVENGELFRAAGTGTNGKSS